MSASPSTAATVVAVVAALAVIIALLTFARVMLRRAPPGWRRFRVGLFVERDPNHDPDKNDPPD